MLFRANNNNNKKPLRMTLKRVLFGFCTLISSASFAGQQFSDDASIHFSNLNSVDLLSHLGITALEQDELGFIWFGTQEGLFKYDGKEATRYLHDPSQADSLSDSDVVRLLNDSEGRLWVVTDAGLDVYVPEKDAFQNVISKNKIDNSVKDLASLTFTSLEESPDGEIWLTTQDHGIAAFNIATGELNFYNQDNSALTTNHTLDLSFSNNGTLWVGNDKGGLSFKQPGSDKFEYLRLSSKVNVEDVQTLHLARNGMLFVATKKSGLFIVDPDTRQIAEHISTGVSGDQANCVKNIGDFIEDTYNNVWIASDTGLCKLDAITHSFVRYSKESDNASSLVHNIVTQLMQDKGGVIWVGTQSGISYWNASLSYFEQIQKNSRYGELSSSSVMSFAADSDLNLYIGGQFAGLDRFNQNTKSISKIDLSSEELGDFNASSAMSQLVDGDTLWIGTFHNGLLKYDLRSQSLIARFATHNTPTLRANAISKLIKLRTGNIAVATYGGGLHLLDPSNDEISVVSPEAEQTTMLVDIKEDNQGYLWLASNGGGLNYVTPDYSKTFQVIDPKTSVPLINSDVYGITVDNEMLWLATYDSGICRISRVDAFSNTNNFQCLTNSSGLASSFPYNILDSDDGYIWVSHSKGLSRIHKNSLRINNFDTTHGLIDGDFHSSAFLKDDSGRLYFGSSNGFNTFMPNNVPLNNYRPPLRLTKFSHANVEKPLQSLLRSDGVLELDYKETIVDFEFAALDYTKPSNNRYQYYLEGQNEGWIDLGTNNHVFFSYLPDGDYTLRVRGSNNEGVWSDEIEINIEVLPPLWASWYAYFTYLLVTILVVLSIMRQQQIKHQRQLSHERRLHQLAYYDSLTGLPNRQSFYENLEKFISLARRGNYRAGVMFIDLDRFKRINDTLGHDYGDQVLQEVAHRLKESVRESDIVARNYEVKSFNNEIARLGGDEFTLFLSHIESPNEASAVTQRIIDSLSRPIKIDHYELTVTPSIGIAMYPDNGTTVSELMKHADIAMYEAKEGGRRTFKFYSNSLNDRALERLQLEEQMRTAVAEQQFTLFYQPQVDLQSNKVTKAEALVRWIHPELGFVSPGDFIPIAEESGLIIELGDWILNTACMQAKEWLDRGLDNCRVSVNVSSVQFKQTALVEKVKSALLNSGLPPHLLELEVTESAVMSDVEDNIERLQQLKNMGITVAVDDFGTGYSSLSYLKRFPIDTLKIDRSFVDDIATDENDEAIVKAIMVLAETMGLKVVAEGIETIEQLKILNEFGCQHIQGFFFSKPLPHEDFISYVQRDFYAEKAMWKLEVMGNKQPA